MPYSKYLNYLLLLVVFILFAACGKKDDDTGKGGGPIDPEPDLPEITELTPSALHSGDIFSIKGKNFGGNSFGKQVIVGEKSATIEAWKDTLIQAKIEIDSGQYQVKVVFNDTLTINAGNLKIIKEDGVLPLQITNISPNVVQAGNTFELTGNTFGESQGSGIVKIGNTVATEYLIWNDLNIKVRVPADMVDGDYPVVVVTATETSNAVTLTIKNPVLYPQINTMTPTSAKVGEEITLTGEHFGTKTADANVYIGTIKCTDHPVWNDGKITFVIPANAITDTVKVHIGDKISNGKPLTIIEDGPPPTGNPTITSTDKEQYAKNASARISGSDFGKNKGKVIFSPGKEAIIVLWSDTLIRINLPEGAISGPIYVVTEANKKSNEYNIYVGHDDVFPMKLISKGTFVMGNNSSTHNGEAPEHNVTISFDFYMAETELTQGQYRTIMQTTRPSNDAANDNCPVHYINFIQSCEFCNKLSTNQGLNPCYTISGNNITCDFSKNGYRLPTEAEWEYAAKAGTNSEWGFSGNPLNFTWCSANFTGNAPKSVKNKQGNNWGLFDMNGNVAEWCWDNYSTTYYSECANGVTDPKGSTETSGRQIIRGGHIQTEIENCKTTVRDSYTLTDNAYTLGFRFVRRR